MMLPIVAQGPTPLPPPQIPFDPNQLIPLIGMVGGMIVAGVVLYAFFKSDIAAAMAERIRGSLHRRKGIDTAGAEPRVAQLEERLDPIHRQGSELAQPLDFAERPRAAQRAPSFCAGGKPIQESSRRSS